MTREKSLILIVIVSALLPMLHYYPFHKEIKDPDAELSYFIENTKDVDLLQDFLRQYPNSASAKEAQDRLNALNALADKSTLPVPHLTKTFRVTPDTFP